MKSIVVVFALFSTSVFAMGDDYKKNKNGGYEYTGGSHIKGCSNKFQVGVSTKQFVVKCMKIDGIAVRNPERIRTYQSRNGLNETYVYGKTTFFFKDGILDGIAN
jgi:hypothetical protein